MTNLDNTGDRRRRSYSAPPLSHYSSTTASIKGCCCCLFLLFIFISLLALAAVLVVILVLHPKKPEFDLKRVEVENLFLSPTAAISVVQEPAAYLSINIVLEFTAVNPNKVGIRYAPVDFRIMHNSLPLAVAKVPGFEQPAHSTQSVKTRVSVNRFSVLQSDAVEIIRDASVNDRMELQLTGDVGAKVLFLGFSSPRIQVSLICAIVISPKNQSLIYKQCSLDGLNI